MNTDVEQYLMEQLEKRKNRDAGLESAGARDLAAQNNLNNFYAVLADSSARAGSLGGKMADSSAVRKFADSSAASNNALAQQMRQEGQEQDQEMTRQEQLAQYLLNKKEEREKLAQQERISGAKLSSDEKKTQEKLDQEKSFKERELSLKEKELQQKSSENQQKLAKEKEPTQPQYKDAGYGKRIEQANAVFDQLEQSGYDRTSTKEGLKSYLPRQLQSAELQKQEQAERNFVNAVLRQESGAAISPSEFESAQKQYFPRAGDTPEVLAQKKQNREQQLQMFQAAAGGAWKKIPSVELAQPKKKGDGGTAYAEPAAKNLHEMSDDELDAELARLKGGK